MISRLKTSRAYLARAPFVSLLFILAVDSARTAGAQAYRIEKASTAVPEELAPAVREALADETLRVVGPNGPVCELWLRKALPAKASLTQELGIAYGQLAEGTLVGAIRFHAEVKDYRRQRVQAGVYTLRYALLPVDGNHVGVSPQRDFLLLAPSAVDTSLANLNRDETLNLGRKVTGTAHPSVWSLGAPEGDSATPAISHIVEGDLWVLRFRVPLQSGSTTTKVPMVLVVVGHAPEA